MTSLPEGLIRPPVFHAVVVGLQGGVLRTEQVNVASKRLHGGRVIESPARSCPDEYRAYQPLR